jgi:hypothetical protein
MIYMYNLYIYYITPELSLYSKALSRGRASSGDSGESGGKTKEETYTFQVLLAR